MLTKEQNSHDNIIMNNARQRLITLMEGRALELENEIKEIESIRCGREEYKENVRKVKILKLGKSGLDKAIAKHKAALTKEQNTHII